ncbi:MAG TPA: YraN family protein [Holophagaceae bacterium]|nr:YraN family protein [Holophagaceae bacterium]
MPPVPPSSRRRGEAARRYGRWTERLTFWLLWLRGFEAVAWREKVGRLELDLILARGRELRVLEVKARARGAWVGGDLALGPEQRRRLQWALRSWLDRRPWPGEVTFQRVSWSGLRCRFHPPERWEGLGLPR